MKNKYIPILAAFSVLAALSLACSLTGGKATEAPAQPEAAAPQPAPSEAATEQPDVVSGSGEHSGSESGGGVSFPMPDAKIEGLTELGGGQVNFQVEMSLDKVIHFYKQEFKSQGLTEREILFSQTDTTFSMVFDGDPGGKAIVVQGVAMQGMTNVNIRYEDV